MFLAHLHNGAEDEQAAIYIKELLQLRAQKLRTSEIFLFGLPVNPRKPIQKQRTSFSDELYKLQARENLNPKDDEKARQSFFQSSTTTSHQ